MQLDRTSFILEKAKLALSDVKNDRELISTYFTEYILITFSSEMEEKVKASLHEALSDASTEKLAEFITSTMATIFKRICKKDLAKTVGYFGAEKKEIFNHELDDRTIQEYGNFIENRHNVAHSGKTVTVSWDEIQNIVTIGEAILNAFRVSLEINP